MPMGKDDFIYEDSTHVRGDAARAFPLGAAVLREVERVMSPTL